MSRRHRQPRPINEITLKEEDVQTIRSQQQLIQQQQHILSSLQMALIQYIEKVYHVDLSHDSWELNLEEGKLRRGQ